MGIIGFGIALRIQVRNESARRKIIPFKKVVNPKNTIALFVSTIISYVISGVIIALLYFAFGATIALIFGIVIIEITLIFVNINAGSYVHMLVKRK